MSEEEKELQIYHKVTMVFGEMPEPPIPSRRELVNGTIERCAEEADKQRCPFVAARIRALKT